MPFITRKQKTVSMKILKILANLEDHKSKQGFIEKQTVLFVDKSAALNTENVVKSWPPHHCTPNNLTYLHLRLIVACLQKICEDTRAMLQSRSTAIPRLQKKERWGNQWQSTVKPQWLEHGWFVYRGWFELFFQSLQNSSNSSRKQIFRDFFSYLSWNCMLCVHIRTASSRRF